MGKIFALIGRSGTGKSTIERELSKLGYERIISNSTRPRREGEKDGIDYHFITEEEFKSLQDNDQLLEHTTFRNWNYAVAKKDISKLDTQDYIAVVNPHGFYQLKEKLGSKIVPILIYCTPYETMLRLVLREPNADYKIYAEVSRRYISDTEMFGEFEDKKLYKYKVYNGDLKQAVNIIDKIIKHEQKQELLNIEDIPLPSKVKIVGINNIEEANHLTQYIGEEGIALYSPIIKNGIKRWKIIFNIDNTFYENSAYFRRNEFKVV